MKLLTRMFIAVVSVAGLCLPLADAGAVPIRCDTCMSSADFRAKALEQGPGTHIVFNITNNTIEQYEVGPDPATTVATPATPLVIGETFTLQSSVLGESRRINVYRPQPWGLDPKAALPVLYMPDGGIGEDFLHVAGLLQVLTSNGSMRPFLLVGIENTERRRDMTGPSSDPKDQQIAPRIGGSASYRRFMREELMPQVRERYATTDERALIGESLAGLFVVETLVQEPTLFNSYTALDPSLWWNHGSVLQQAAITPTPQQAEGPQVFLASSSEPELAASARRLASVLRQQARASHVVYRQFPDETHATIYHPAALQALRALFAPAAASSATAGE